MTSREVLIAHLRKVVSLDEQQQSYPALTARALYRCESLVKVLTSALNDEVPAGINCTLKKSYNSLAPLAEENHWLTQGGVLVRILLFGEPIYFLVPLEIAHELASAVLHRERSSMLAPPDEFETTAFGLLIARVLASEEMFKNHRVYLSAVHSFVADQFKAQILSSIEQAWSDSFGLVLDIETSIQAATFPISVILSPKLRKRLLAYAEHDYHAERHSPLLKNTGSSWRVRMDLELGSMLDLLSLKEGQLLHLFPNSEQVNNVRLQSVDGAAPFGRLRDFHGQLQQAGKNNEDTLTIRLTTPMNR